MYSRSSRCHVHFVLSLFLYSRFTKPIDFSKQESCCLAFYFTYIQSLWLLDVFESMNRLNMDYKSIKGVFEIPSLPHPFRVAIISIFKISKTHWLFKTRIMLSSIIFYVYSIIVITWRIWIEEWIKHGL